MKIAYLTNYDAKNPNAWSGTGFRIPRALAAQGFEVDYLGPLPNHFGWLSRCKFSFYPRFLGQKILFETHRPLLEGWARSAEKKIQDHPPDLVLGPHAAQLAYLKTAAPVALWADSTFAGLADFYEDYQGLCAESERDGHEAERRALARCRLAIFASEWAAQTARDHYGLAEEKIRVVEYGANIDCARTAADIERFLAARSARECHLLFIGKVWSRKGGDLAIEVAKRLNEAGCPARLTMLGSKPPAGRVVPDYVTLLGFVDKSTPDGRRQFEELFSQSHFLLVPSRAEAYGIVFCEASSFGVPSLATAVGGIPTVIRQDQNGRVFPLSAGAEAYADYVWSVMRDQARYRALALSSFAEYRARLNWEVAGQKAARWLRELAAKPEKQ